MKSFAGIKNIGRFVPFNAKEQIKHISSNGHFLWLYVSYYLHDIRLSLPVRLLQKCYGCSLARMGGGSLSLLHKIKFHLTMPKNNENLTKGSVASLPSTPNARKASTSKTEKLLKQLSDKVITLQRDNEEKDRRIDYLNYYISSRGLPHSFSYFEKEHPIDSQDWGKLYKMQCQLNKI